MTPKREIDPTYTIPKGRLRAIFWKYVERVSGERSLRKFIGQGLIFAVLSDFPTTFGVLFRTQAYKGILGRVGSNCFIEKGVRFRVPQRVFLGDRVYIDRYASIDAHSRKCEIRLGNDVKIGEGCFIKAGFGSVVIHEGVHIERYSHIAGYGGVEIGKNALVSNNVEILSSGHIYDDPSVPIKFQGLKIGKIKIGEDVWLGAYVVVLPGVKIGDGSVVGAGAVVTKDIPKYSVAVGVPARVIKKRG